MSLAYIGLGANLGHPVEQLRNAIRALQQLGTVVRESSLYRSAPLGGAAQPDYCNAVVMLETSLPPEALMAGLLDIERAAGRVRGGPRWASRVLDLDLLHYEGVVLNTNGLRLPHPEIARRNFVLVPLAEVAPQLDIPGLGPVAPAAAASGREGLTIWQE